MQFNIDVQQPAIARNAHDASKQEYPLIDSGINLFSGQYEEGMNDHMQSPTKLMLQV